MRITRQPAATAAVLLILVAGCGSSGSAADGTTAASSSAAAPATASSSSSAPKELLDVRYCEVIPAVTNGDTINSTVYNTLGFNNCPERQWKDLTEDIVNSEFGSQSAQLNGPRHLVIDQAQQPAAPAPIDGVPATFTFGGIETGIRGQLATPVGAPTVGQQSYTVNTVQRDTAWTYLKGTMIYQLTDPDGNVYVMQSYSQQSTRR